MIGTIIVSFKSASPVRNNIGNSSFPLHVTNHFSRKIPANFEWDIYFPDPSPGHIYIYIYFYERMTVCMYMYVCKYPCMNVLMHACFQEFLYVAYVVGYSVFI